MLSIFLFCSLSVVAADSPLEITVAPKKASFAQGQPLAFTVTVKNVSTKPLRIKEIVYPIENSFAGEKSTFVAGEGDKGGGFRQNVGLWIRQAAARGRGAPPPGEDVPAVEIAPGKAETYDFDFQSSSMQYAIIRMDLVRIAPELPPGNYTASFTFHFAPPQVFQQGKFVAKPDPTFFTGDVKSRDTTFQVVK